MTDETKRIIELLKSLEGKTISSIEHSLTYEDDIHGIEIITEDGDKIEISPTSFNYGGQYLNIDIK